MKEKYNHYKPNNQETLGGYLKRLREAASAIQGKKISLDTVADRATHLPEPQRFTSAWLSKVEVDGYNNVGGDKLRTLSHIYSKLLNTAIQPEWMLIKAGFAVQPALPQDDDTLHTLIQNDNVLALVGIVGQLIEMGYEDDVQLIVTLAQRYLNARNPKAQAGDIFDDSTLSEHVGKYMEALGLV